ncbi:hypothetical protein DICVIV_11040 [Dictyocaulus viviparus]|uniref:Uncharacterized protein n=1 Tax=Dictyocaulus viviparus TaxID=29172 RepID=A0A0D8XGW4_DICVI|nr:hypothetical protein DICVIV_11040 [Dictyocaulus viviparus]
MRAIAKTQKERHLLQHRACLTEREANKDKLNVHNEKIVIEDKAICMVCKEAILCNNALIYLKTGYLIHSKCMKYPNLCPITNAILIPPE